VDLTCNARDTDHAEQLAKAIGRLDGVEVRKVSDRNLPFLHFHRDAA
jgi:malate dehydrogenase (oxaloacetate-decarboxylating)